CISITFFNITSDAFLIIPEVKQQINEIPMQSEYNFLVSNHWTILSSRTTYIKSGILEHFQNTSPLYLCIHQ
ncbi:MAG TPA: hypothetical protein VFI29_15070, partial [Hanamia sp.]|nr:hypothetical protein [Hanamia sp.]